jgi:hypothetical protein
MNRSNILPVNIHVESSVPRMHHHQTIAINHPPRSLISALAANYVRSNGLRVYDARTRMCRDGRELHQELHSPCRRPAISSLSTLAILEEAMQIMEATNRYIMDHPVPEK